MSAERLTALATAVAAGAACARGEGAGSVARDASRFWFVDVAAEAGLGSFEQENGNREKPFIVESVGGGAALLDYDADGWLDVYLSNGSSLEGFPPGREPRDALYRNRGDATFEDATLRAGLGDSAWTCAVAAADVDDDGWTDLYLANYAPNALLRNRGDGTFADVTADSATGDPRWSAGACFFDSDRDGDLDLYVANYVDFVRDDVARMPRHTYRGVSVFVGPKGLPPAPDALYRNEGGCRFTDATEAAGIRDRTGHGFQPVAFDFDEDGDLDVFVANDSTPHFLWRNDGDGTFTDVAFEIGVAVNLHGVEQAGMGVGIGDCDGDGHFELFLTTFSYDYSTLYRREATGLFADVTQKANLVNPTLPSLGWGCGFFDVDADGDVDLLQVNGHVYPQVDRVDLGTTYRQRNQLFENVGGCRFAEATDAAGPGFAPRRSGRGAAFGDIDNDGDVDVLVSNIDDGPTLLRNDSPRRGRSLLVRLVGAESDRDAIGAVVTVTAGGRRMARLAMPFASWGSASDPRLHFGLGDAERASSIEVRWPRGRVEAVDDVGAGQIVTIEEGKGIRARTPFRGLPALSRR